MNLVIAATTATNAILVVCALALLAVLRAWQVFQQRASIKRLQLPASIGSAGEWPSLRGDDLRFSLSKDGGE